MLYPHLRAKPSTISNSLVPWGHLQICPMTMWSKWWGAATIIQKSLSPWTPPPARSKAPGSGRRWRTTSTFTWPALWPPWTRQGWAGGLASQATRHKPSRLTLSPVSLGLTEASRQLRGIPMYGSAECLSGSPTPTRAPPPLYCHLDAAHSQGHRRAQLHHQQAPPPTCSPPLLSHLARSYVSDSLLL